MEKIHCNCGMASMTYEVIGEDEWSAKAKNTSIVDEGGIRTCQCKICRHYYDSFDPFMVVLIEHE